MKLSWSVHRKEFFGHLLFLHCWPLQTYAHSSYNPACVKHNRESTFSESTLTEQVFNSFNNASALQFLFDWKSCFLKRRNMKYQNWIFFQNDTLNDFKNFIQNRRYISIDSLISLNYVCLEILIQIKSIASISQNGKPPFVNWFNKRIE